MQRICLFVLLAAAIGVASIAPAAVTDPWVTTDRTVDCSSYETILKQVLKPEMTDEQKAIALFTFYRQRVYHFLNVSESRDPLVCINVIGNTLCGSQGTDMKGLLTAAGIKARVVSGPGHTFYEAYYDGQWHGYDTFMNFYIMTRGDKPHVASFQELEADPSLISEAKKDGRAVAGMAPCGDDPLFFSKHVSLSDYPPLKLDWSVKRMALCNGEELVRSWWPAGKPLPGTFTKNSGPGPLHTCGSHDRSDNPDLFKFWEPYAIPHLGPSTTVSYRHYANGLINYAPDLTTDAYRDGVTASAGVKAGSDGLSGEGELTIPQICPFYISAGQCLFAATCPNAGDSVTLSASRDGKQWTDVATAKNGGPSDYVGDLEKIVVRADAGLHAYQIKFALKGKATLNHYLLQTWFTHNPMAAPHLMPGKNRVTVAVANPDVLASADLRTIYRYRDAPAWNGEIKVLEQKIGKSPLTYDVELPESKKLPQMVDLTLRSGKLAWTPAQAWQPPAPVSPDAKK